MVLYLGPAAVEALLAIRPEEAVTDAVTPVFKPPPRHHPAASAAGSAGGWAPRLAGHHRTLWAGWYGPGPVGCRASPSPS